jgi:hypothetical protein
MRRFKIAALITTALAMLAVAAVAVASSQFKQTSNITLTATKAGKSTGFKAAIESSDPGEPGGKPQALKTLTITLPSATKFNFKSKAIAPCTASDTEIKGTGGAVCPAKSKIGSGSAEANGAPAIPQIPENATAYASKSDLILLLAPKGPAGSVLVLHGTVSGNKVTVGVPVISAGGISIVITALNLTVNKLGSGKTAFITAGKCASGKFKVKSNFLYYTGATVTVSSSSKCSK